MNLIEAKNTLRNNGYKLIKENNEDISDLYNIIDSSDHGGDVEVEYNTLTNTIILSMNSGELVKINKIGHEYVLIRKPSGDEESFTSSEDVIDYLSEIYDFQF